MPIRRAVLAVLAVLVLLGSAAVFAGCQTLREVANLRDIDYALGNVARADLAGVDLAGVRSYEDLRARDILRIGSSLADGQLPLQFQLGVEATNPEANNVQARMVEFDWTLFIEDRETVSGVVHENFVLPPGQTRTIPIDIQLDLLEFFDRSARDIVDLVLAFAGQGQPRNIRLQARPTIDTPVGPIRYPDPITIVSRDVGER